MCITLLIPIILVCSNLPFVILHRHRISSCWSNLLLLCTPSSQQIPPDVITGNKDLMSSELKCQVRTIKLVFNFYSLILLDNEPMYYSCNPKTSSSFSTFCIVQCAILKEVLLADDLIVRPNNCLHMYHFICIDEWLKVGFIVCYIFSSDHEEIVRSILLERCLKLDLVTERTLASSDQEH